MQVSEESVGVLEEKERKEKNDCWICKVFILYLSEGLQRELIIVRESIQFIYR